LSARWAALQDFVNALSSSQNICNAQIASQAALCRDVRSVQIGVQEYNTLCFSGKRRCDMDRQRSSTDARLAA
jgi:hypothetical protein